VSRLKDLTITIIELKDLLAPDAEVTKYKKQELFKD
jgi:hypothetical protein